MPGLGDWRSYCSAPEAVYPGNSVRPLLGGAGAFGEMFAEIRGAQNYILAEFYAVADDAVGRKFAELLKEKAAEGVKVFLLFDSVGSILTGRAFFSGLSAAGVSVAEYRPVTLWKPYRNWLRRDHRKLLCVDGKCACVGGFNITDSDAPAELGGRGWKDAAVLVKGPAVRAIEEAFWYAWRVAAPVDREKSPPLPPAAALPAGPAAVAVLSSTGLGALRSVRRAYCKAIDTAREYIYITNAYFLPDRGVARRLEKAARRGVDVRIIVPGQTDHPYVRLASWSRFGRMLRSGIKLYEWREGILHSKTAVIDGAWSSVGSHNLDYWSLHYNLELNVAVFEAKFCSELAAAFREDLLHTEQVTAEAVRRRPLVSRLVSRLLYSVRALL